LRYSLLKSAILIGQAIPFRLGSSLADFGGDVSFVLSSRRRKIVCGNLKRILGAKAADQELQSKTRKVFKNVARNYFDLVKFPKMNLNCNRKVAITGWQHLVQAQNMSKGVILATAHLGNFEMGAQVLASRGVELTILIEEFSSNLFLREIANLRQRKGIKILPINMQGMKDVYRDLIRGGTVIIVCDRDIQGNGIKIKFMGEETTLPFGAVSLALRTGAALVPIFSVRGPNNLTSIYIESPLNLVESNNQQESLSVNLEKLADVMEEYIRKYPEQWAVLEPFWLCDKVRSS
jgi:phosphatidylinositol dimannoside acyltransferase